MLSTLIEDRRRIWSEMPTEVSQLSQRRGALNPLGPILYAESETRIYTEILSQLLVGVGRGAEHRPRAQPLMQRLASHLSGWYGLSEAGAFVQRASAIYGEAPPDEARECLGEVVLYLTRLNFWLDLLIPWDVLNRSTLDLLVSETPRSTEGVRDKTER